jgi:hypothetical protein
MKFLATKVVRCFFLWCSIKSFHAWVLLSQTSSPIRKGSFVEFWSCRWLVNVHWRYRMRVARRLGMLCSMFQKVFPHLPSRKRPRTKSLTKRALDWAMGSMMPNPSLFTSWMKQFHFTLANFISMPSPQIKL